MKRAVIRYVENNPTITLNEICKRTAKEVREKNPFPPNNKQYTEWSLIQYKKLENASIQWNSTEVKLLKKNYGIDDGHRSPASSSVHR